MKRIALFLIAACAACAHAGRVVSLHAGETNRVTCGRVLCVEAATVTANQSVTISTVASVTEQTNCTAVVWNYATNYVVCASNVVDATTNTVEFLRPVWRDVAWPDQRILWVATNDVSTAVTNTWRAPKTMHTVTTNIWTGTASGHYIKAAPESLYLVGGDIFVTAGPDDHVELLIGE